jgi:CBS domain-containing protein
MRTMRVRDVMTRRVVAVTPNTPFRDVAELMLHHEIGAIPVIDDTADLIGLITEADLITKQAYGDRRRHLLGGLPGVAEHEARGMLRSRAHTAREVMSAPVETALPDDPLRDVARRMIENRLRHVVVVDDDRRMVGIVSRRDLLRVFDRTDDEIAAEVRTDLARSGHLAGGDVSVAVDGGLVTLDGRIRELAEIPVMCRLAWLVPGVVDVVHHLTVTPAWGTTAVEPAEAPVAGPGPPAES